MKKNITKRITALAVLLFAAMVVFTGCSKDEDKDYLYTIGIEDYSHTIVGESSTSPIGYLSGLNIADGFTITAENESDADVQAPLPLRGGNGQDRSRAASTPPQQGVRIASAMY